jgi:serine/threonine protein phosphatase 1
VKGKMDLFVIGDVHGCLYTFSKLLEKWRRQEEMLIQLGDLVDRGNHSPEVLGLALDLQQKYPRETVFLKGNHELMLQDYLADQVAGKNWLKNGGDQTLYQFDVAGIDPAHHAEWILNMPLFWENEYVFVSHAGISGFATLDDPRHPDGLLWNRKPLRNIGRLQIVGHTPRWNGQPQYFPESKAWNIDTCAYGGICLTAIRITKTGQFKEIISIPTDGKDVN